MIIHSVDGFQTHWHNELELLLVLDGSIDIRVGSKDYRLKEGDLILVNPNELHSTKKTGEDNILLAAQIDPNFYNSCFANFSSINFDCKSFKHSEEEQGRFDTIRRYMARMAWELNKRAKGYRLQVRSYMNLLGVHLLNEFDYSIPEEQDGELTDKDFMRLKRIIRYIDRNSNRKITLDEVAEREHFNYYYLSHFIKDKLGMSFQDYLRGKRLNDALEMLVKTEKGITEIAYECGFPNMNSFNQSFRDTYGCTPGEYRERHHGYSRFDDSKEVKGYLDVDRNTGLEKLFTYIELDEYRPEDISVNRGMIESIYIDRAARGKKTHSHWNNLITFGRAREGLGANWQEQLKGMQKDIGFKYIRFHGIFNDEMMVYNTSPEGTVEYNWTYVDELFDFLLSIGLKPFVELGFMPSELGRSDDTIFWWAGNISPPKDMEQWTSLVTEFIRHCINRYGMDEVKSWYFEVWNEPELRYIFWAGTQEEYFEFYRATVLAIKSISRRLRVGGPSITHGNILGSSWLDEFLVFCRDGKVPLDFLSVHIYPEYTPSEDIDKAIMEIKNGIGISELLPRVRRVYYGMDHVSNTMEVIHEKINTYLDRNLDVHVTEWNASSQFGNLIHDTCYTAIYIIKNVLESMGKVESLGYWTFTDIFEENKLGISHFHGGFGLINKDGLKKPSYYAYLLLSKLGDEIIEQGDDYIVTRSGDDIQILGYNYIYFDNLFLSGEVSHISHHDRYSIYEHKDTKVMEFNIENISGDYRITNYKLNRESGSTLDAWIDIGAPENMSREEIEYLQGKGHPDIMVEHGKLDGRYKVECNIPVHGAEMIILKRKL
ncbi:MAG: helix-turn-helix domain-containing protein [Tissierellia bacterium]|nr:helix-turn-helix domain-containing protein [Tissierellia bacterium]